MKLPLLLASLLVSLLTSCRGTPQAPDLGGHVTFLFTDHLGLTRDPAFTDNVLYLLLEAPR